MRWTTHGERLVYDNPWVRLALVDVQPPGGGERFEHHVVRLFSAAIAVVLDDQDRVLMLWRHRFVSDQWGWELPGGIIDDDEEDGAKTAARETEEETGWRPAPMTHIVSFQPMTGMVDAPHEVYLAQGAEHIADPEASEEAGEVSWIPLAEIPGLLARGDDHGLVFCDGRGLPLRPGGVTVAFEAHVKACGLPAVRLHDTRHGACSLLLAGGVPMEIVQMILGHSSPEVTRRVYRHLMRKATAAQVESATELLTKHRRQ